MALPVPEREELEKYYPRLTIEKAGKEFGIGQTLFLKWLEKRGIPRVKTHRQPRTLENRKAMSEARKGKIRPEIWKGENVKCHTCGKEYYLSQCHIKERNYCSYKCLGKNKSIIFRGENSPTWKGGIHKKRSGKLKSWRNAVLARDKCTCQHCGDKERVLHAHHIKSYKEEPKKRFDVSNGITLCVLCHWKVHGYDLNSKNIQEFKDDNGRLNRRWIGECKTCHKPLVKQASDMKNPDGSMRDHAYCSHKCANTHFIEFQGKTYDSVEHLARETDTPAKRIRKRLNQGWNINDAVLIKPWEKRERPIHQGGKRKCIN